MKPSADERWEACIAPGFYRCGDRAVAALEAAYRDGRREAFEEAAQIALPYHPGAAHKIRARMEEEKP